MVVIMCHNGHRNRHEHKPSINGNKCPITQVGSIFPKENEQRSCDDHIDDGLDIVGVF